LPLSRRCANSSSSPTHSCAKDGTGRTQGQYETLDEHGYWPLSLPDLPVYGAPSRAGGGNAVRFLFPPEAAVEGQPPLPWQRPCPRTGKLFSAGNRPGCRFSTPPAPTAAFPVKKTRQRQDQTRPVRRRSRPRSGRRWQASAGPHRPAPIGPPCRSCRCRGPAPDHCRSPAHGAMPSARRRSASPP